VKKVAIISTRLGGIDGVSIEAAKWAKAYKKMGFEVIFIAGRFQDGLKAKDRFILGLADYYDDRISDIRKRAFSSQKQDEYDDKDLIRSINEAKDIIKKRLKDILLDESVDHLSIENALSIPLNIPLGIAITEVIKDLGLSSVTRHHDFFWERKEFGDSRVDDILKRYFPPDLVDLKHVVINTIARDSIIRNKDIEPTYIPNIFDFDILEGLKDRRKEVRDFLEVGESDYLFLQPTRIIQRKRLERSIELVSRLSKRLKNKVILFISGRPEEDEIKYFYKILAIAKEKKINLILNEDYTCKSYSFKGKKVFERFSIYDIYNGCDLVTLPSDIEGFGNPVIESAVFKKPLFVNRYPVLKDMLEKGFDFAVINKAVDDAAIEKVSRFLKDRGFCEKVATKNFEIVKKHYSISFLIQKLGKILGAP